MIRALLLSLLSLPVSVGYLTLCYWSTKNILLCVFFTPLASSLTVLWLRWQLAGNDTAAPHNRPQGNQRDNARSSANQAGLGCN